MIYHNSVNITFTLKFAIVQNILNLSLKSSINRKLCVILRAITNTSTNHTNGKT